MKRARILSSLAKVMAAHSSGLLGGEQMPEDAAGALLDFWQPDELQELGEIRATLPAEGRQGGDVVQVTLRATATETGTLELTAVSASDAAAHWKVELDVRDKG